MPTSPSNWGQIVKFSDVRVVFNVTAIKGMCVDVCVLFRWRYFLREACTITWVTGVLPVLARARAADRLSEPGRLGEEAAGDQVTRHHKSSTAIIKYNI